MAVNSGVKSISGRRNGLYAKTIQVMVSDSLQSSTGSHWEVLSVTGQRTHLSPVNFSSNEGTAVFRIAMCSFESNGAFLGSWLAKLGEAGARVLKTQWSSKPLRPVPSKFDVLFQEE